MTASSTNSNSGESHRVIHHITQFFGIPKDAEIDFFDANLVLDSRAFIDPFLLKNSSKKEEALLFDRFGMYFRFAYDQSLKLSLGQAKERDLRHILTVREPKNINMGYTVGSNDGHGPSLADRLLHFFMDDAAKRFVRETDAFPDLKYNPVSVEVFTSGIGPDGISDITANLVMDYLVQYTQQQAKLWGIPLKTQMPLDRDGFDFDTMSWRGGGFYDLPENPYHSGQALILVPRRWLRGLDEAHDNAVSKVMYILRTDELLSKKFSDLVSRKISEVDIEDIRSVFKADKSVHFRYLQLLESERSKPYDFGDDPLSLLADRTYDNRFAGSTLGQVTSGADVARLVELLINEFTTEFAGRDGWRDAWKETPKGLKPQLEPAIGRKFRAMGYALFALFDDITFGSEYGTGDGSLDFMVIYKNYKIAIEFKLLKNSSSVKGDSTPAYIRGIERQLPHYIELTNANKAYYITGQHYNGRSTGLDHSPRTNEIREKLPSVIESLKSKLSRFEDVTYINVDMSQRPSASKL